MPFDVLIDPIDRLEWHFFEMRTLFVVHAIVRQSREEECPDKGPRFYNISFEILKKIPLCYYYGRVSYLALADGASEAHCSSFDNGLDRSLPTPDGKNRTAVALQFRIPSVKGPCVE